MLRSLLKLSWIEIKVFLREPMGAIGTIVIPVILFLVLGKSAGFNQPIASASLPVLVSLFIAINAVLSMVNIVSIYREGGILKRLRATPLRPQTILGAHILVKLLFTAISLLLMFLAGKRYLIFQAGVSIPSFACALLLSTIGIISIGFLIASIVPTARFAQPIGALILYPMIGISGLFVPIHRMGPIIGTVARILPMTYAVSLLNGIWNGDGWSHHLGDVAALVLFFFLFSALSEKFFRWE
ncbi:MAG: ABC transporter permease [Acidobacteriota bacterium]|nr:ABC transporter permease [Acidobacteriota bacterium]